LAGHFEQSADWLRAIKYLQLAADAAGLRFEPRRATEIFNASSWPHPRQLQVLDGAQPICHSVRSDPPTRSRLVQWFEVFLNPLS